MKRPSDTQIAMAFAKIVIAFMLLMAWAIATGRASTTTQRSQREVQISDIPVLYLVGYVESGRIFRYHEDTLTNLIVQPLGASQIWDRSITFCGDISSKLQNISGPAVALAYSRVQSRTLCYDLLSVHDIVTSNK